MATTAHLAADRSRHDATTNDSTIAWVVVAGAAATSLIVRLLVAREVVSPFIFQDEGGYIGVARLLAGQAPALYGPTYLPGMGLLLAPAAALLEPGALQNVAQGLNALAGAALIPALHLIGRRVAGLPPLLSAAAAITGGLTAASLLQATMLLPEALLLLAVAVAVLVVHACLEAGTWPWAVAAGGAVGWCYAVHPRSIVVVLAAVLVAVIAWRTQVLPARSAVALAGTSVAVTVVVQVLHTWATDRLYPAGTQPSLAGSPIGALGEPVGAMVIAAGQSWYLIVASLGLVPLGLLAAGHHGWTRRGTAAGLAAGFVLLGALGSLALGTLASYEVGAGRVGRADLPLYGRYLEQWVPVLIVFAPTLVRRWARPAVLAVAGAAAGLGLLIHASYPAETWTKPIAWHNIASLRVPIDVFGRDHVVATGFVAAALVLGLCGLAVTARRTVLWLVPLGAVATMNVVGGLWLIDGWAAPASQAWAARHRLGPVVEEVGEPVWVDLDEPFEVFWAYNVQFWHPDVDIAYFDGAPPAEARLVLGGDTEPPVPGAVLVGAERDGDLGLWATQP